MAKSRINPQIMLKPHDLVVLLRLSVGDEMPTYADLAAELGMSASKVHDSLSRSLQARLVFKNEFGKLQVVRRALLDFVLYGARYAYPAILGEVTRGLPTLYAASPIKERVVAPDELPPVWPDRNGKVRGMSLSPLYPEAAFAAERNPELYELLVLFDAIRAGSVREQKIAQDLLKERLS